MRLSYSIRIKIIIILSMAIPFQSSIRDLIHEARLCFKTKEYKFASYDDKFKEITKLLPKFTKVGYFTDKNDSELNNLEMLGLTKYALAPVIVANNTDHQLIVAHFHQSFDIDAFADKNNYRVLNNFNNEVLLFEKKAEP